MNQMLANYAGNIRVTITGVPAVCLNGCVKAKYNQTAVADQC